MSIFTGPEYDPKNMIFRRLGDSGLRVPIFSIGAWLTIGQTVQGDVVKDILTTAFNAGINLIDTAEGYAQGQAEVEIGRVIKEVGWRRSDLIITTKIFFGVGRKGANDVGLSRKHIIEGLNESLERLQLDYVDIVFAHRPDSSVPMHEVVRAFNFLINQGKAFYWATSEWSARQIEEAFHVADQYNLIPPIADQCNYSALNRARFEVEYAPLYKKYNYGTTVFSALAGGVLSGKYNDGIPTGSRFDLHKDEFKDTVEKLGGPEGIANIEKVKKLTKIAEELGCKVGHLALAWAVSNPNTSTVILGASKPEHVTDNLKALEVLPKLTPEIHDRIKAILDNEPASEKLWFGDR